MHKWVATALVLGGAAFVAKKTDFVSYAGTLWSKAHTQAKNSVPTGFEIDRARHEIAQLERDVAGMVRPLAEHKAALGQLERQVAETRTNLDTRRAALLAVSRELETKPASVNVGGRTVPADKVQAALDRDFDGFVRLEKHLESLQKLHEVKQSAFESAQEQLSRVVAKKREFELRVAQLAADEESLRVASIGDVVAVDDHRASAIEASLREIERRHQVRRAELELSQGDLLSDLGKTPVAPRPGARAIREYLEKR